MQEQGRIMDKQAYINTSTIQLEYTDTKILD